MKEASQLFAYVHDGKLFYRAVMKRLARLSRFITLAEFCDFAELDFSTAWRWNHGSKPTTDMVQRVEDAMRKIEKQGAHIVSSSVGIRPSARR